MEYYWRVFFCFGEYVFISYGDYHMKKDYNRYCHRLLRIEEIPFLFVFVFRPSALSNVSPAYLSALFKKTREEGNLTVSVSGRGIENKKEYGVKPCHTLS